MTRVVSKTRTNVLVAADHAAYEGKIAGVGQYLLNVLPRIDRERFNVTLIILRDAGSVERELDGTGVRVLSIKRGKFDPSTLRYFLKTIRHQRTDVIHLHQYAASDFGRLAGALTAVPSLLHVHGPDLPYPPYQWLADRLLARFTDSCIAVSESLKNEVSSRRAISSSKIITLHNGIPLGEFQPPSATRNAEIKRQWRIPHGSPVVGTVTRLHEVKGNRYLLEAATAILKVFPQVYFVVVGDGPLLGKLEQDAARRGLSRNVIFAGHLENVIEALSVFDIKVVASTAEGHPQAMLEAMAMGKAVVATDVGGIPEVIRDGHDGLLVPPADPGALADSIMRLLQDEEERHRLGEEALKRSRAYSLSTHVRRLENIYEHVIANHRARVQSR